MQLLTNAAKFSKQGKNLKSIYTTFVRPVLEQSAPVWSSSLTQENSNDLERVQKTAIKIIMSRNYESYESALEQLNLKSLSERRTDLKFNICKKNPTK